MAVLAIVQASVCGVFECAGVGEAGKWDLNGD